jgi:hypothetical protein
MKRFAIYAGLGGSFGGAKFDRIEECETEDLAQDLAYETACAIYESYEGMYGLPTIDQIMEEEGLDEETAEEAYRQYREGWLDYSTIELDANQTVDDDGYIIGVDFSNGIDD